MKSNKVEPPKPRIVSPHTGRLITDITGNRYGKLTVLGLSSQRYTKGGRGRYWTCMCDCGNVKDVLNLRLEYGPGVKSCGCYKPDKPKKKRTNYTPHTPVRAIFQKFKSNAKMRDIPFNLTEEQVSIYIFMDCAFCGAPPSNIKSPPRKGSPNFTAPVKYSGLDRWDSNGGYDFFNCVPCCFRCNMAKSNMTADEFMSWVKRTYENLKFKGMLLDVDRIDA